MKRIVVLIGLATLAASAVAQECRVEYQRADNMWAAAGRADGELGTETLTLKPTERKVFITDWKYEKRRNDGENYYGSHLRIIRNAGVREVSVTLSEGLGGSDYFSLKPGERKADLRADMREVYCPGTSQEARQLNSPPTIPAPSNLTARQTSPREIVLNWQPVAGAKEYRVYVNPPPAPHLAGRATLVSAPGGHFVISLPATVAAGTVYDGGIEAVGTNGAVSLRALFPRVAVQLAATSGPGTSSTPTAGAGQQCPPGQFVTGFTPTGSLICAAPAR